MIDDIAFEKPKKKLLHEIGCDLAAISVEELHERIILLKEEIIRLDNAIKSKQSSLLAAELFFKK